MDRSREIANDRASERTRERESAREGEREGGWKGGRERREGGPCTPRRQRARRAPASPVHHPSMEGAADGCRPSPNPPAEFRPIHHFSTVVMTHQRISQLSAAGLISTDIFRHRRLRISGGTCRPSSRPHQPGLVAPSPELHFSDRGSGRQREAPSAAGALWGRCGCACR